MPLAELMPERFASARVEAVLEDPGIAGKTIQLESIRASGNKKVNPSIEYEKINHEYVALMHSAVIKPEYLGTPTIKYSVRWYAANIAANRPAYAEIETATGVPWFVIGILHGLECTFSFEKHLFNGDPLSDYTKRHPRDHPRDKGSPPFSFKDSAVAALDYDKFSRRSDWSLARTLFRLEGFNGMSYRTKYEMATPYLWSFTSHYDIGKYKEVLQPDGRYKSVFDPSLRSKQCGSAAMLKELVNSGVVSLPDA